LSHDIDLILEILNLESLEDFRKYHTMKRTAGSLNIDVDTEYELQGVTVDDVMVRVYLNGYSKTKSQTLTAFFENGQMIIIDFIRNVVIDGLGNKVIDGFTRQELFEYQAKKWISQKEPSHNELNRSTLILQLIEESWEQL